MQAVYKEIGRVAEKPVSVLILGETGTGKELVARALWQHGPSMLMLSVSLTLAVASRQHRRAIWFLGAVLGAAYVVRPTNAIAVVALTGWVAWAPTR